MINLLLAAAISSTQAMGTVAVTPRTINDDGVKATYTQSVDADGTIRVRGFFNDGKRTPFSYVAKGRHVRGTVGRTDYAFQLESR